MATTIDKAVEAYINLRDRKKAMQDRHKEELGPLNEGLATIEAWLQHQLNLQGAENVRTAHGTVYLSKTTKATIEDWGAFRGFILENNLIDMMEHRVSKTAVEEYMESAEGHLPPGIAINVETNARIRR